MLRQERRNRRAVPELAGHQLRGVLEAFHEKAGLRQRATVARRVVHAFVHPVSIRTGHKQRAWSPMDGRCSLSSGSCVPWLRSRTACCRRSAPAPPLRCSPSWPSVAGLWHVAWNARLPPGRGSRTRQDVRAATCSARATSNLADDAAACKPGSPYADGGAGWASSLPFSMARAARIAPRIHKAQTRYLSTS
jgi:hypothetical protein